MSNFFVSYLIFWKCWVHFMRCFTSFPSRLVTQPDIPIF
ncbi:hypothetical protein Hsw_1115 [Hymenobacter swuensis DY53]|uniref:Uncharacterized protein n=1 Tax=Hymenobacter swuensis DY53 TaxID=1227739 RepID=W8F4K7_9BACT|nr:hypothetical protein Hsw_1115 [Hymenobacter swuensis DY53]